MSKDAYHFFIINELDLSCMFFIEIYMAICVLYKRNKVNYLRGMHFSDNEIAFLLMKNVFISGMFSLRFVDNDSIASLGCFFNPYLIYFYLKKMNKNVEYRSYRILTILVCFQLSLTFKFRI